MNDWISIQSKFGAGVEELHNKLPTNLDQKFSYEDRKASFWIQACPGFDCEIYVTPDLIGTNLDHNQCDLPCDFDAGIAFTIRFTFNYFESLLTKKSRLCRCLKNGIIYTRCIEQWDGQSWMNTQGNFPKDSDSYEKQFLCNNLSLNTEENKKNLDFFELLNYEQK